MDAVGWMPAGRPGHPISLFSRLVDKRVNDNKQIDRSDRSRPVDGAAGSARGRRLTVVA
ncbi:MULTISPECIES: hypothetical protein [Protofrankia]|uniref:hypothetical protein n=1 Tax=Protofrankia TaxID=2994361 RepID=UPI000AC06B5A|nr:MULTISPECIES: hypothetical protein [Protofrankia]